MNQASLWGQLKVAAAAGVLAGGRPYATNVYYVGSNAPAFGGIVEATIADALAAMVSGDVLMLGPQVYAEGNLIVPSTLNNITIVGMGPLGTTFITPGSASDEGLQILGSGVSLINIGINSGATADYSLKIGSASVTPVRTSVLGCRLTGNGAANPAAALVIHGASDTLIDDCQIYSAVNGILGVEGLIQPTNTTIKNCRLRDITTVGVGVAAGDLFLGLYLEGNKFDRSVAGVAPTDFINLSDNANIGTIEGNFFASATNATGTITIGSGLFYPTNYTEAGPTTARPA